MSRFARKFAISSSVLTAVLVGCSGNPAVTISTTYLEQNGGEIVEVGSTAVMTSDKPGAIVTVGGTVDDGISASIVDIAADKVVVEVTHPKFEPQRATVRLGESNDVFFADGNEGVRIRFTEAK
jgi:hypothetical protein